MPRIAPFSPKATSSTSGVSETQTKTTSLRDPRSLGLVATGASSPSYRDGVRFHTAGVWPAAIRLATMPRPMVPRPMNPSLAIAAHHTRLLNPWVMAHDRLDQTLAAEVEALRSAGTDKGREAVITGVVAPRSEEHTSELQSRENLVCRL